MKRLAAFSLTFAFGLGIGGVPQAQTPKPAPANNKCQINATSDKFVADLNGKTGQFIGNVLVTQCDTRLRADTVRITTVNNQADKVNAAGNVVVESPKSGIATGQSGIYDVPRKIVILSGNVVLKKNKDVMRGAQLTINLGTGQATLGGGVKGTTPGAQGNGRVQAVFSPNSAPSSN